MNKETPHRFGILVGDTIERGSLTEAEAHAAIEYYKMMSTGTVVDVVDFLKLDDSTVVEVTSSPLIEQSDAERRAALQEALGTDSNGGVRVQ